MYLVESALRMYHNTQRSPKTSNGSVGADLSLQRTVHIATNGIVKGGGGRRLRLRMHSCEGRRGEAAPIENAFMIHTLPLMTPQTSYTRQGVVYEQKVTIF